MLADPGKMKRLIARVIQAERDGNKVIADMAKRVDKTQPGIDAERRAKEIITVMTERNVQNAVTKRVLDAIRKFLDKLDVIKSDTTDADIAEMLRKAHSYLRESGRSLM
jgi:Flp pilus assembly CpaF family ATPase